MEDSTFTIDQIGKLREIERARMKHGGFGLRSDLQALIMRLQSGGVGPKSDDPREIQAKRLWDKGFGREQGFDSFDAYLATIPEIPEAYMAPDDRFPELVLVDARLGLEKTCELLGVDFDYEDQSFEDFDPKKARTDKVYWIRAKNSEKIRRKSVCVRSVQFTNAGCELGLTAHEGVALLAQNPEGFRGCAMDLPGSVMRDDRMSVAFLHWVRERPELFCHFHDHDSSSCGSAFRTE